MKPSKNYFMWFMQSTAIGLKHLVPSRRRHETSKHVNKNEFLTSKHVKNNKFLLRPKFCLLCNVNYKIIVVF